MAKGRETAVLAALQVLGGREVDAADVLIVAEYLRSGRLPTDETREAYEREREQRVQAERRYKRTVEHLTVLCARVKDVLDNDGDMLDEARRVRLMGAYRWSERVG